MPIQQPSAVADVHSFFRHAGYDVCFDEAAGPEFTSEFASRLPITLTLALARVINGWHDWRPSRGLIRNGRGTDSEVAAPASALTRGSLGMSKKETFRVVTRGSDGKLRIRDFPDSQPLLQMHTQIGVDDCSTDLALRGLPVFRGLIGPMPEGKSVIRYESPEVFETLTKEWSNTKSKRRRRRATPIEGAPEAEQI